MASSKKTKGDAFLAFAEALPPLPTNVLASAVSRRRSAATRRAAELMVGAVDSSRVARVAAHLDELVELDRATSRKRRNAGR